MNRHILPAFIIFGSVLILNGCYTQVGSTRQDGESDYYSENDNASQAPENEEYVDSSEATADDYYFDENGNQHSRYYFSYYYPSFAVGATYYDPWYWHYGGYSYYSPFWCGTYYPAFYSGWYTPASHYYPNPGGYAWGTGRGSGHGSTRIIGNTRTGGGSRGRNDSFQGRQNDNILPGAMNSGASVGRGSTAVKPKVSSGRRTPTNGTRGVTRSTPAVRGGNTKNPTGRAGTARQPQHAPQPSAPAPEVRSGNRGGETRSVAPAPAPAAPQGGTRSGGSRGDSGSSRNGGRR